MPEAELDALVAIYRFVLGKSEDLGVVSGSLQCSQDRLLQRPGLRILECRPFTGIDLDGCVDPQTGEVAAWAMEIVRYFDSYTEVSVTGTGLHIIIEGEIPNRRKGEIEVYSSKRFFTVTGHELESPS